MTVATLLGASAASALPLGDILEPMSTADEAAVSAAAQDQITNQTTRIKSIAVENLVFEGSFVPSSATVKLAVVSDDGVTITINGQATNVTKFGQGQGFENFGQSFKVVNPPVAFVAGTPVTIKVQYSNTTHTNSQDFDGITLFVYGGTAQVPEVNLILHHGQGGAAVVDSKEEGDAAAMGNGAFTVANRNDSDSDGVPDQGDNNVADDPDLMKLEISRPTGPATDTLTITPTRAALWTTSSKGTLLSPVNAPATLTLGQLPKTVWVEVTQTSDALRDVSIELNYKGQKDLVKATGVWAEVANVEHNRRSAADVLDDPVWKDLKNPQVNPKNPAAGPQELSADLKGILEGIDGTGLTPVNGFGIANGILIKFRVLPSGVEKEPIVVFDISRQSNARAWTKTTVTAPWVELEEGPVPAIFPTVDDKANDDATGDDESIAVDASGHLYVIDAPGLDSPYAMRALFLSRASFREFARVKFNGVRPSGELSGSRCADKYEWHATHYLERGAVSGKWRRVGGDATETDQNEVALGPITVGTTPP